VRFWFIKSKIWEIRGINWNIVGLGISSNGGFEICPFYHFFAPQLKILRISEGQLGTPKFRKVIPLDPLKYLVITKIQKKIV